MTDSIRKAVWQKQVLEAFSDLKEGFENIPLEEGSIAPLRHLTSELNLALFRGFDVFFRERDFSKLNRSLRLPSHERAKPKAKPELTLEELLEDFE
jgi:hypothetical protein